MSDYYDFCGSTWKVVYKKMEDNGECDFDNETIYINNTISNYRQQCALVHELLHVWYDYIGVNDNEELVCKTEHGVLGLILLFGGDVEASFTEIE